MRASRTVIALAAEAGRRRITVAIPGARSAVPTLRRFRRRSDRAGTGCRDRCARPDCRHGCGTSARSADRQEDRSGALPSTSRRRSRAPWGQTAGDHGAGAVAPRRSGDSRGCVPVRSALAGNGCAIARSAGRLAPPGANGGRVRSWSHGTQRRSSTPRPLSPGGAVDGAYRCRRSDRRRGVHRPARAHRPHHACTYRRLRSMPWMRSSIHARREWLPKSVFPPATGNS